MCNISASLMCLQCNGRQNWSALTFLKESAREHVRHVQVKDIIWRAVKRAQYSSVKEPVGLLRSNGKRPDAATLISWTRGKPLAWDITVGDMCHISYVDQTATREVAAVDRSASHKTAKYTSFPRPTTSLQLP